MFSEKNLVVGSYNNYLWFHIDGDAGATYWDNVTDAEKFMELGFSVLNDQVNFEVILSPLKENSVFFQFFKKKQWSDVKIFSNEGDPFLCHKIILASQSDFFEAALTSNFKESSSSEIKLTNVKRNHLEMILKFIYGESIKCEIVQSKDFEEFYAAVNFLQIPNLITTINAHMGKLLTIENACFIYEMADFYGTSSKFEHANFVTDKAINMLKCYLGVFKRNQKLEFLSWKCLKKLLQQTGIV